MQHLRCTASPIPGQLAGVAITWATSGTLVCGNLPGTNLGGNLGGIDWWLNVTCNLSVTPAVSLFSNAGRHCPSTGWYSTSWSGLPRWPHRQLAPDLRLQFPH